MTRPQYSTMITGITLILANIWHLSKFFDVVLSIIFIFLIMVNWIWWDEV